MESAYKEIKEKLSNVVEFQDLIKQKKRNTFKTKNDIYLQLGIKTIEEKSKVQ